MASFDEAIPPGQAGKVQATIRTEGMRGPLGKAITVTTNDPVRPIVTLTIRANLVGSVEILPTPHAFIVVGQTPDNKVNLVVRKDATETGTLQVSDLVSTVPWLSVKPRKVDKDEPGNPGTPAARPGDWVLEAQLNGDPPSGQSGTVLRFRTGLPREPEITVPVTVRVLPEVNLSTTQLVLPAPLKPGEGSSGVVYATVRADRDAAVLKVEAQPSAFRVSLEPSGPKHYKVQVTWTPTGDGTPRDGTVTLRLGSSSFPVAVRVSPAAPGPPPPATPTPSQAGR